MNEHDEYLRERGDYMGPVTWRDLLTSERGVNWAVIVVLLLVIGFWAWVGYNVARWLP